MLLLNEVFPLPEQTVVSACNSNALPAANDSHLPIYKSEKSVFEMLTF